MLIQQLQKQLEENGFRIYNEERFNGYGESYFTFSTSERIFCIGHKNFFVKAAFTSCNNLLYFILRNGDKKFSASISFDSIVNQNLEDIIRNIKIPASDSTSAQ